MRIYGEAFFLLNGWMDFLSFALAASLGKHRFRTGRAVAASFLGASWAVAAWTAFPWFRSLPALAVMTLLMSVAVFGRDGLRLCPLFACSGWFFSGITEFTVTRGAPGWAAVLLNGAAAGLLIRLLRGGRGVGKNATLQICLDGKTVSLPVLRDSGNLLNDRLTGLPVIVVPAEALGDLLPPNTKIADLSTLPRGWRLLRTKTAGGNRTMMCFRPDGLKFRTGSKAWRADGVVAAADFQGKRALAPEAYFTGQKEDA